MLDSIPNRSEIKQSFCNAVQGEEGSVNRALKDEEVAAKELSSACFYSLSGDVSVRASEDLATADKLFPGALYIRE